MTTLHFSLLNCKKNWFKIDEHAQFAHQSSYVPTAGNVSIFVYYNVFYIFFPF